MAHATIHVSCRGWKLLRTSIQVRQAIFGREVEAALYPADFRNIGVDTANNLFQNVRAIQIEYGLRDLPIMPFLVSTRVTSNITRIFSMGSIQTEILDGVIYGSWPIYLLFP